MFEPKETVDISIPCVGLRARGIIRYADRQQLVIGCPAPEAANIPAGSPVRLVQALPQGLYQINTVVLRGQDNILSVYLVAPQIVQRRGRPRVECVLSAWYRHEQMGRTEANGRARAVVRDLSPGGAGIYVENLLPLQTDMDIEIELRPEEVICAKATILRANPLIGLDADRFVEMHFSVGLRFKSLSRLHQVLVLRFIQDPPPTQNDYF